MAMIGVGIFLVENLQNENGKLTSTLRLSDNHPILQGHFPAQPVVPGACMLALVKDVLAEALNQKLQLKIAGNIKFMQMITPANAESLQLTIIYKQSDAEAISLNATITNVDTACFKLQAVFRVL